MYQRCLLRVAAVCVTVLFVWSVCGGVVCAAADPPGGPLYAWYRDGGLQSAGADVTGWNSAAGEH
ncbi:MAG: hypothetical protein ACKPJD_10820, partial [Planctomycetaceae bacterium]